MKIKEPKITIQSNKVCQDKHLILEEIDYPVFCLRHLHKNYCIEKCLNADKSFPRQLIKKIGEISKLSWSEIKLASKNGLGAEKIDKKSIRVSIPTTYSEDVDFFTSFYFNGTKGRIIGHRSQSLFHILYIDTDLSVYKHN